MKNDDIEQQLNKIINDKMIYPVYQPIICNRFISGYKKAPVVIMTTETL